MHFHSCVQSTEVKSDLERLIPQKGSALGFLLKVLGHVLQAPNTVNYY